MALRWTAVAMNEAKKGFRSLKAYKQLPALRLALAAHYEKETNNHAKLRRPLNVIHGNDRFTKFNKARGNSSTDHEADESFEDQPSSRSI